ncbi:transcriptional regulator [Kribbella sp.]|uniref:transcriptional regulator n=1 Tax=Kribbella sp. TaxID=1871183 RepID=UPI002D6C91C6|nr:transcriptional regulator [Kribbella sp.]HZX08044.1 transcriptional regulator [Kribbella sp.]
MNEVLDDLLRELSWSPRVLARRLNREFGAGTVAETAPYHWRDSGGVPRPPLPALVAHLLSCELGRLVTVGELWQRRATDSPLVIPADAGMRQSWTRGGTLGAIDDWVVAGLLDRRQFLAISGVSLTSFPGGYLADEKAARAVMTAGAAGPLIEQTIPLLQRLDDASGGGAHLEYVSAQFRSVALLLRQSSQPHSVESRLFSALAEIGQLAGWMAFDAGLHGPAQRYLFTALRAAHECGYKSMAAHVVADLAFQAATREQSSDAVALGEFAAKIAERAPASVRASVQTRLAYGYAVAGDLSAFERAHKSALDVLASSYRSDDPAWMYYLTPSHLDTQAGYALTHVGTLASGNGSPSNGRSMLRAGEKLLRRGAYDRPLADQAQRRALFEGAWLATAAAGRGDLEEACILGRTAVARTATVRSARSLDVLGKLAARLRRAKRNEYVRDFLPSLESCIRRGSVS